MPRASIATMVMGPSNTYSDNMVRTYSEFSHRCWVCDSVMACRPTRATAITSIRFAPTLSINGPSARATTAPASPISATSCDHWAVV